MFKNNLIKVFVILGLAFVPLTSTIAQDLTEPTPKQKITLGVRKIEPFIMNKDNQYSGFSIDLWNQLARDSDLETTAIKEYPNVIDLNLIKSPLNKLTFN